MIEKKIFQEIPKKANFHSVVMTTFSFDFHHFESQVLRGLKSKGITNINVFVDEVMLDLSLGFANGNIKSASKSYSVNSISSKGVFHPKITMFIGENDICLVQGSGNITNGGHGKNHELFSTFYASKEDKTQLPLITEAWQYIKQITHSIEGFSLDKLNWVSSNCNLFDAITIEKHKYHKIDNDFSAALVYNENNSSIWKQITALIPNNIDEIQVFSPFYDEKGTLINNLLEYFNPSKISAFMQEDKGIHPFKMETDDRIEFLDWKSTGRGSLSMKHFDRKQHSKVLVFNSNNTQYCLLGSANATIRAFGTSDYRGANDEFSVLLKIENRNILEELNLKGNYKPIKAKDNKSVQEPEHLEETLEHNLSNQVKVLGADQNGKNITLFILNKSKIKLGNLKIYDNWGDVIYQDEILLSKNTIKLELKGLKTLKNLAFLMLYNSKSDPISNKQMINSLQDLWNTNPSVENRKLLKLSSIIETGKNGVFDMINFFNTIESSRAQTSKKGTSKEKTGKEDTKNNMYTNMSYEEAIALNKDEETHDKIVLQHHTVKIWDAIESYFNALVSQNEEEGMDEEEEGQAESSRDRNKKAKDDDKPFQLNSEKVLKQRRAKIVKFLNNYEDAIDSSMSNLDHEVNLVDFAMYMIVLKHLLELVNKEVILKNSDTSQANERIVLYNILGAFNESDNFSGGLSSSVGSFINLIYHAPLRKPEDDFLLKKQEHLLNLARNTTLFTLAISKDAYKNHPKGGKWLDIMALNILNKFGVPEKELTKYFESLIFNVNMDNLIASQLIEHVNLWINLFQSENWRSEYLVDDHLGVCDIVKKIPLENPKFIKISRPGFSYNENAHDFVLDDLYNLKTKDLMASLQEYKNAN